MRNDGKRIKSASPEYLVGAYLMHKRYDALNMTEVDVPLDPISAYIRAKRGIDARSKPLSIPSLRSLHHDEVMYIINPSTDCISSA